MSDPIETSVQTDDGHHEDARERDAWVSPAIETMSGNEVALLGTATNPCAGQGTLNQNSSGPFDPCKNT
jgi:hypothetical protein